MKMGERSGFAAKSSIAALQERALGIIASRPGGVYQSDLRRLLGVDSSKCSKVVARLQGSGLIYREKVPASSTFLLMLSSDPAPSHVPSTPSPASSASLSAASAPSSACSPAASAPSPSAPSPSAPSPSAPSPPFAPAGSSEKEAGDGEKREGACWIGGGNSRKIQGLLDRKICSYFDCHSEDDLAGQIGEDADTIGGTGIHFGGWRSSDRSGHIDSYLTDINLLYLTRAPSF